LSERWDNTVPSLAVIEQLSLLSPNKLDACTDPTSEFEIGVNVNDHGMYTLRCMRLRPDASVNVIVMTSRGALVPVTV
jgi:hypothetical protein